MSETQIEAASAEPAAAPDNGAEQASSDSPTTVIGSSPQQETTPQTESAEVNAFEAQFGQYFNADGSAKDGWTEKLPSDLGLDDGRLARLGRQTSFNGVIKALSHAQDAIEKRDGTGEFVPDPSNENALRDYRDQKGVPQDITDPQNGYDFRVGIPEGIDVPIDSQLQSSMAELFQKNNISRDSAREIVESFNSRQIEQLEESNKAFEAEQSKREQDAYNQIKKEWGMEFELKDEAVGRMHKTYEMDMNDPVDRTALTNPKVIRMMADLAAFSKVTESTPESGTAGDGSHALSPSQMAQELMQSNPNWKNDTTLRTKIETLFKQSAAMKK